MCSDPWLVSGACRVIEQLRQSSYDSYHKEFFL
jgi:hypothetical protein